MKKRILEIVNKKIRKSERNLEKYREIHDVLSDSRDEVILKLGSTIINSKSAFKMILSRSRCFKDIEFRHISGDDYIVIIKFKYMDRDN